MSHAHASQPAVRLLNKIDGVTEDDVRAVLKKGPRSRIGAKHVRTALLMMGRVGDATIGLQFGLPQPVRHKRSARRRNINTR